MSLILPVEFKINMNQRIKLKSNSESRVFLTSDGHFNQENLEPCANRNLGNREERTERQIQLWNSVVTNNDIVIDHGDLVFNDPKGEFFEKLINRLNFKHLYLLAGNHLSGTKNHFQLDKQSTKFFNGRAVTYLGFYWEFIINSTLVCASHFPIAIWNGHAKGAIHTFGHVHNNYQLGHANDKTRKCLDIGMDQFPAPIEFYEIKTIMDTKGIAKLDHHV